MIAITATIPTREEWVKRQAQLPAAARAALGAAYEREREAVEEHRKQREDARRRLTEYRAKFEADLAAALVAAGAEWLAAYRVPDVEVEGADPFDLATTRFFAKFDARAVGVWPLYVRMVVDSLDCGEVWVPSGRAWTAAKPGDAREFDSYPEALAHATTHTDTPF